MTIRHQPSETIKPHHLRAIRKAIDAHNEDTANGIAGAGWRSVFALGNCITCQQLEEMGIFEGAIENPRRRWNYRRYRIARNYMESNKS